LQGVINGLRLISARLNSITSLQRIFASWDRLGDRRRAVFKRESMVPNDEEVLFK